MAEFVPYGKLDAVAIQCIHASATKHGVPEALLHAYIKKENGTMGQCSRNKNGTYDCGLAQINTIWAKEFAQYNVDYRHVMNDACTNIDAQGYIARKMYNVKKDWFKSIVSYNIGPNNWTPARYSIGHKYASDVVKYWWEFEKYRNTNVPPPSNSTRQTQYASYAMPPASSQFLGKTANPPAVSAPKAPKRQPTQATPARSHPKAPFFFSVESDESSQ